MRGYAVESTRSSTGRVSSAAYGSIRNVQQTANAPTVTIAASRKPARCCHR